jgi:hypothetical protein
MTRLTRPLMASLIAVSALIFGALSMAALASTAPGMGTATSYAILAGTTVTNTGNTVITGDLGVSPGTACTGLPAPCTGDGPGTVSGAIHAGDAQALQAQTDLTAAYGVAASSPSNSNMTGQDLGDKTLTPGTYTFSSSAQLTGTLTLNGNGVYIFQIASTLTTAPGATVSLIDAQPCNVFWQVGSSATLDTTTTFVGTIMALTDIHLKNEASIAGRALARNGEVTLINNQITAPTSCTAPSPAASPTASPISNWTAPTAGPTPTPVPLLAATGGGPQNGVLWLLLLFAAYGVAAAGLIIREQRRRV